MFTKLMIELTQKLTKSTPKQHSLWVVYKKENTLCKKLGGEGICSKEAYFRELTILLTVRKSPQYRPECPAKESSVKECIFID